MPLLGSGGELTPRKTSDMKIASAYSFFQSLGADAREAKMGNGEFDGTERDEWVTNNGQGLLRLFNKSSRILDPNLHEERPPKCHPRPNVKHKNCKQSTPYFESPLLAIGCEAGHWCVKSRHEHLKGQRFGAKPTPSLVVCANASLGRTIDRGSERQRVSAISFL